MKITSKGIKFTVDTVDELLTITGEENQVVIVSDENRGGTFIYRSAKSTINDGGVTFNGWSRQYDGAVYPEWFGAKGDGITDDTLAIQKWKVFKLIDLTPNKNYFISTIQTINLNIEGQILNGNNSVFTCINLWGNTPFLKIDNINIKLQDLEIKEIDASGNNTLKNQSQNIGLYVQGKNSKIINVKVEGFCFPLLASGENADGIFAINSDFSRGYAWVQINSIKNGKFINCSAHHNGLDGWKVANYAERLVERLDLTNCSAYSNGQRSINAGGLENTNGNGLDLYNGGYELVLTGFKSYGNYGSGINMKGDTIASQPKGIYVMTDCTITDNLTAYSGSAAHGIEINIGGVSSTSLLTIKGGIIARNTGYGMLLGGGYGICIDSIHIINNVLNGINIQNSVYDSIVTKCNIYGNGGLSSGQIVIGATTGTQVNMRVRILLNNIAGKYNPNTYANYDPIEEPSTDVSNIAIRVQETAGGVIIEKNNIYNHPSLTGGMIWIKGSVDVIDNFFYGSIGTTIFLQGSKATSKIYGNTFYEVNKIKTYDAAIQVASQAYGDIGINTFTNIINTSNPYSVVFLSGSFGKINMDQIVKSGMLTYTILSSNILEYDTEGVYSVDIPTDISFRTGTKRYKKNPNDGDPMGWILVTLSGTKIWKPITV